MEHYVRPNGVEGEVLCVPAGAPQSFNDGEVDVERIYAFADEFADFDDDGDKDLFDFAVFQSCFGLSGAALEPGCHRADWEGDGRLFYGVHVENGRIVDAANRTTKSAFREIVEGTRPGVIFTPNQNVIFSELTSEDVSRVQSILARHGVSRVEDLSVVRRFAMSCPALPTCGLALTESERVMPAVLDELERKLSNLGVDDIPLTVRMVGCPNGCSRPYTADLAFVGHHPGKYDVCVGGRLAGDRFVDLYAENVPLGELVKRIRPLLERWSRMRMPEEGLGDFYQRVYGSGKTKTILSGAKDDPAEIRVLTAAPPDSSEIVNGVSSFASIPGAREEQD